VVGLGIQDSKLLNNSIIDINTALPSPPGSLSIIVYVNTPEAIIKYNIVLVVSSPLYSRLISKPYSANFATSSLLSLINTPKTK